MESGRKGIPWMTLVLAILMMTAFARQNALAMGDTHVHIQPESEIDTTTGNHSTNDTLPDGVPNNEATNDTENNEATGDTKSNEKPGELTADDPSNVGIENLQLPMAMSLGVGDDAVAVIVPKQPDGTEYRAVVDTALLESGTPNVYSTLEAALSAATSGKTVVLLKDDYTMMVSATVKNGVMLLLPCDDALKAYESNGFNPDGVLDNDNQGISKDSYIHSSLTIPFGVTLTVNGDMLVNAVTGRPRGGHFDMDINGGYSKIYLDGDIIINAGGMLDVCGLIEGSGQVTVNNGGALYDLYVVRHWRGGTQASYVVGKDVYPINEYDCHNIQTPVRINNGGVYVGTVKMRTDTPPRYHYTRFPQIHNSNGLIQLTSSSSYALKTYDTTEKRSTIKLYGGADASSSRLDIAGVGDLSTVDFIYPVDGDITFELYDGNYNITEDFKFLTGSHLHVGNNATLTINVGKTAVFYDEFNDVYSSDTRYPARPPAQLSLGSGARLKVNGTFAGQITSTATGGSISQVEFASGTQLSVTSYESNVQAITLPYGGPYVLPYDFAALLKGGEGYVDHIPAAGYTYSYTDGRWSGGNIPSGSGSLKISGKVTLQGRTNHSGTVVTLKSSSLGDVNRTVYTDSTGAFTITGLESGIYSLTMEHDSYLSYEKSSLQVSGSSLSLSAIALLGGDINNSGTVTADDLIILLGNYQRSGAGDINNSGTVTADDLIILLGNYQKSKIKN